MPYVDAIFSRTTNTIHLCERRDGQRIITKARPEHVFYYGHPTGSHRSIFGDPCKKYSSTDLKKFTRELARARDTGKKIFESDINPIFRYLADHYPDGETPVLSIGFFDIEVDFHPERGFAPPDDPFNAITAITVYLTNAEMLVTLVLRPPTLTMDEARAISDQFENTILFDDEIAMLNAFIEVMDDVDVFSGWNCVPLTEGVWLDNCIVPLRDVRSSSETFAYGQVARTHRSGLKRVQEITLANGSRLRLSDEHVVPIYVKERGKYKNPSSLLATRTEKTVKDIRELSQTHDVYIEQHLRENNNAHLTYREFFRNHLGDFLAFEDFDISLNQTLVNRICAAGYQVKHDRYRSRSGEYPRMWRSKRFPEVTTHELLEQIAKDDSVTLSFQGNHPCVLDLNEEIAPEVCQLLGLLFTDGTYYRKQKHFTAYGKDVTSMTYYRDVVLMHQPSLKGACKKLVTDKDGVNNFDFRRCSKIGVLAPMIYTSAFDKKINVQMLSRLSSTQFSAFFSGLIDGDGFVSSNRLQLCDFDDQLQEVQELCRWNGVYTTTTSTNLCVSAVGGNQSFVSSLTCRHTERSKKIDELTFTSPSNSANSKLKKYVMGDKAIVRIENITSGDEVEMGDIETRDHYFVVSGCTVHNSEGFDIPYVTNRIALLMGKEETKRLCLWDQYPREREYMKFGKMFKTYDLVGRVHLDYLLLYQKHNTQQLHSYRLDYVGEIEVNEHKIPYSGTLDDLYKKDFFKFIEYNRQDVMLLVKIDAKRRFIELANQIAHTNCVLLKTTVGSVALVEQAIINEMHSMGFVVPDRRPKENGENDRPNTKFEKSTRVERKLDPELVLAQVHNIWDDMSYDECASILPLLNLVDADDEDNLDEALLAFLEENAPDVVAQIERNSYVDELVDVWSEVEDTDQHDDKSRTPVVGAYVAKPKTGIHSEIGCVDINSLYPSAIRSLNMSPETIVGQVSSKETMALVKTRIAQGTSRAEAWDGLFSTLEVSHMMARDDEPLEVSFEDGTQRTMTGDQLYRYIFDPANHLCITANGTIFSTERDGIIPLLLAKWYSERKSMQGLQVEFGKLAKGVEIDDELAAQLRHVLS